MNIRNCTKYGIVVLGVITFLMLSTFMLSGFSQNAIRNTVGETDYFESTSNIELSNDDNEPITIVVSESVIKYTYEDLNKYSDTVLIGTVKEIFPSKWNTNDGKKPNKPAVEFDSDDLIYTDVVIDVTRYIKNPLSSNEVVVRVMGGVVEKDSMADDSASYFKPDEKVLLYLSEDTYPPLKNVDPDHFVVTGSFQGKFSLTDDRNAVGWDKIISQEELLSKIES